MRRLSACVLVSLAAVATVCGGESLPLSWNLAEIKDLQDWGEPARDGDRTYRPAEAGKAAVVRLPNWWGGTPRPPRGKAYVFEVTYRDDADAPVVAEAHAGVASYFGRSELHRFGGEKDGKWKTAYVPASWDLLMLPPGSRNCEIAFRSPVSLPVEKIVVREARLPEDADRYDAESRAWIAKIQAGKAAGAKFRNADETPEIPDSWAGKPMVPYARAYYDWIYPNSAPRKGEAGAPVHVLMARNEIEPGAFGVYAREDIEGVEYSISELKGPTGKLECEIRCYAAEYALEPGKDAPVWSPQRLWRAFPVSIKKGRSAWFYFTVRTLGDKSLPGKYEGTISIRAGAKTAGLPLKVEVLPIKLLTMDEAGLGMGGCVTGLATEQELETMRENNHNIVNLWFAGAQPGMKREGDRLVLDFYYFDDWMKRARDHGVGRIVWFLGGNPNGYPETLSIERDLYSVWGLGSKEEFFRKMGTAEQRGKILEEVKTPYRLWLQAMVAHAKEAGWPELIFTPFDEPAKWAYPEPRAEKNRKFAIGCGPWIRDHFKAACALIHEAVPGTKVYISMHRNFYREVHGTKGRVGEIFIPDVDIVCTNAIDEDHELGDKVRRAGKEFWQYGGGASRRYGYGFYFAAWDSRGSLCWAYNWGKRFDITEGSNWLYAWYSPFGTIQTPIYHELREGWDDRRYLETAKAAAKAAGADITPLIKQIREETLADRGKGGRDLVNDFWEEGRTASKMDAWRGMLAKKIMELAKR
ncbi:MAG: hypothetical protein N3A38_07550 [Planctomycetota bacterium]|nr:hypothetical protein [Planctomycetota bacterium]